MRRLKLSFVCSKRNLTNLTAAKRLKRFLFALLVAHAASIALTASPLAAQEEEAVDRTATRSGEVESPPDDAPQALHDAASLERDASHVAGEASPSTTPSEAHASGAAGQVPALPPKPDLLGERLAAGDGSETEPLYFEHEGVKYVLLTTEPHDTRQRAKNELDRIMLEEARKRYAEATHSPRAEFWFPIDLAFVRGELLAPDGERLLSGAGGQPRYVGHALLRFDQAFERRLRAVRVASRSMQIVVVGGAGLGLLCVAFAFLRLDRATRGLYTGRLQTWAVVAGAVVLCISGAAAYWVPWI